MSKIVVFHYRFRAKRDPFDAHYFANCRQKFQDLVKKEIGSGASQHNVEYSNEEYVFIAAPNKELLDVVLPIANKFVGEESDEETDEEMDDLADRRNFDSEFAYFAHKHGINFTEISSEEGAYDNYSYYMHVDVAKLDLKAIRKKLQKLEPGKLLDAIKKGNLNKIGKLLAQGEDPNQKDKKGTPVVFYALGHDNSADILRLLVNYDLDVNSFDPNMKRYLVERSPKGWDNSTRDYSNIYVLLDANVDINCAIESDTYKDIFRGRRYAITITTVLERMLKNFGHSLVPIVIERGIPLPKNQALIDDVARQMCIYSDLNMLKQIDPYVNWAEDHLVQALYTGRSTSQIAWLLDRCEVKKYQEILQYAVNTCNIATFDLVYEKYKSVIDMRNVNMYRVAKEGNMAMSQKLIALGAVSSPDLLL